MTAAPAPTTAGGWLARAATVAPRNELFIDGRFVPAATGRTFDDIAGRDGSRITSREESGGYFIPPTILDGVDNTMRVAREEIFGPVLTVIEFEDEDEAIAIANDSPCGLAAGLWTRDVNRAHRLSRRIRAGVVWVNTFDAADITVPFGGYKQSGFGRDKGLHALDGYTQLKTTWFDLSGK